MAAPCRTCRGTYILSSATGETDTEYTATESKVTTINSDTFGFMVHQSANYITIEESTDESDIGAESDETAEAWQTMTACITSACC